MTEEIRNVVDPLEFRGSMDGRDIVATGYAVKWQSRSRLLTVGARKFFEEFRSGAFTKTLAENDIVAWQDHEPTKFLGRTSSGTLRTYEDETGLAYEIRVPDTSVGRDFAYHLTEGDVVGTSFGFRKMRDTWTKLDGAHHLRSVSEAALHHVAPILNDAPAYADTVPAVAVRSMAAAEGVDLEKLGINVDELDLEQLLEAMKQKIADDTESSDETDTTPDPAAAQAPPNPAPLRRPPAGQSTGTTSTDEQKEQTNV